MDLFSTASTETDISEDLGPERTEPEETTFKKLEALEFDQPPTQQDVAWEDLVKSPGPGLTVVVCSPKEFIVENNVPGKHLDVQVATIGYQHIALVCADAELPPKGFLRTLKTALELDPEIETRCYYGKEDKCKLFALRLSSGSKSCTFSIFEGNLQSSFFSFF